MGHHFQVDFLCSQTGNCGNISSWHSPSIINVVLVKACICFFPRAVDMVMNCKQCVEHIHNIMSSDQCGSLVFERYNQLKPSPYLSLSLSLSLLYIYIYNNSSSCLLMHGFLVKAYIAFVDNIYQQASISTGVQG